MNTHNLNSEDEDHERRIVLDGAANFRDIGGYPANRHNRVKWRKIFRSGHLASLTKNDHQVLNELGIRTICDFRSTEEIARQPNRLPENPSLQYLHLPIVNKTMEPTEAINRIMKGDTSWFTQDFMMKAYIEKIDAFPDTWHHLFKCLTQQSSRPLLFHCTAGKDRTGVCAALILLSLGVSEKWVIHDHALSNRYNAKQIQNIQDNLRKMGVDPEKLMDYLTAPKTAIVAVIEHITKKYGSAKGYLIQKANVKMTWIEKFEEDMLY
ncbi:MAG: tyrosine-protein phosphatase [Deltaproteobacteria bacterium]|nr:tyrosine-protein phosphatase [Deltaproteobacteria bacterium]